jgi:hypothetical protein
MGALREGKEGRDRESGNRKQPSSAGVENSEYLAQRRKGRKEIKLPDLASWREQIPVSDSHGHRKICVICENSLAMHRTQSVGGFVTGNLTGRTNLTLKGRRV